MYAEVHLGLKVNYLDIPPYVGQGRGRIVDRPTYHRADRPPPVFRVLVGDRSPTLTLALAPIADEVVVASQKEAIDTVGDIAAATTRISDDRVGQYLISRHSRSTPFSVQWTTMDPFIVVDISTPTQLDALTRDMSRMTLHCLAEDMLEAYSHIASDNGIGIEHVRDHLRHRGRLVLGSHHSQLSTSVHRDPPAVHMVAT